MRLNFSVLVCLLCFVTVERCRSQQESMCRACDDSGICIDYCPEGERCRIYPCYAPPCLIGSCIADTGICPTLASGTVGVCTDTCSGGGPFRRCPWDKLCCSNGCGRECKHAIYPSSD
ncbi:hypothetical protein ACJMK2_005964 [Sinanodonta woodiana]|uniref:Uncharacterized protein n=1 Tax=Sinanodonta woodiana TaxID=1069815 RepID=A0ABD3VUG3_SINWO